VAIPPNSVTIKPMLATAKAVTAKAVMRSGNSSRMRAASPLPVCTANRATISCTTTYAMVIRTIKNKVR
jgi:hypothetical protein